MNSILNLATPYLPLPAQQILGALQPIIQLLSSPTHLFFTAVNNPQDLLRVVLQTVSNLFHVAQNLDFSAGWKILNNPSENYGSVIIGLAAIYITMRTFLGTYRTFMSLFSPLLRYGSLIGLLFTAYGWFTGNQAQGAGANGNIANVINGLGNMAGNNAGANAGTAGLFNIAKGFWDEAQQGNAKKSSARKSKTASSKASSRNAATDSNLGNIAQDWVRDAVKKATGSEQLVDMFMGGGDKKKKRGTEL